MAARTRSKPKAPPTRAAEESSKLYEAEVLPGVAPFAAAELTGAGIRIRSVEEDGVRFEVTEPRRDLSRLRRCVAVHRVLPFDVPRPKALLGHQHLSRLVSQIEELRRGPHGAEFKGFRIGAAGSDSPVFLRLANELHQATGLPHDPEEGELLLRFRRGKGAGWEVLIRLTPRPLSAREWRQCNRPGGLNATVAVVAHDLLGSSPHDRYLNLMCGSGTLLIERARLGQWQQGVGLDLDSRAIACARENLRAAGVEARAQLVEGDAGATTFGQGTFDRLSADLPWGDAVGDHYANVSLYPRFLREAARLSARGGRLLVITHELKLFDEALLAQSTWRKRSVVRVFHGGHRPGLYLLDRQGSPHK